MVSGEVAGFDNGGSIFNIPWPALLGGLVANAAACLWFQAYGSQALLLVLPGLVASGAAVAIRPRSALVLGLAACSGLLGRWALGAWDSAQILVGVLSAVAALAAIVVLSPRVVQRTIVSLIIVVHFIGILSAVFSVPPTPALMNWAWTYLYRPYLQFMYLNNAYHFYSPEPGPGILVWFYVRYGDGSADWYKIPDRSQNPLILEYQRRLSLAESTNQLLPASPVRQDLVDKRQIAALSDGIQAYPLMDASVQHREPNPWSKEMLETYARFVAHLKARETGKTVTGVKIYRVVHNLPTPKEIAKGVDPTEKHFYYPYYQGEFTPDGKLKDDQDPYLYWIIPIVKTRHPEDFRAGRWRPEQGDDEDDFQIVDLLEEHARLPTRNPRDYKPNFVPGGPAEQPPQKNASTNSATTSVPR